MQFIALNQLTTKLCPKPLIIAFTLHKPSWDSLLHFTTDSDSNSSLDWSLILCSKLLINSTARERRERRERFCKIKILFERQWTKFFSEYTGELKKIEKILGGNQEKRCKRTFNWEHLEVWTKRADWIQLNSVAICHGKTYFSHSQIFFHYLLKIFLLGQRLTKQRLTNSRFSV